MSVLALFSARGAPGVTTTAVAMALSWPRPCLLVEADVTGSSAVLAGYRRGAERPGHGLLHLAAEHRHHRLPQALAEVRRPLAPGATAELVPGLTTTAQAPALEPLWQPLLVVLRDLATRGVDVILDAGRAGARHGPDALLAGVDRALLVTRTDLPGVAGTRSRATYLREAEGLAGTDTGGSLALLVVGPGRPYTTAEVEQAVGLPVLAELAWDPKGAAAYSQGRTVRALERRRLTRSIRQAVTALSEDLARRPSPSRRVTPGGTQPHRRWASA